MGPIVDAAVTTYLAVFGDRLHSVFLRGSVAKGEAIEGVSDLDTLAFVNNPRDDDLSSHEARLESMFPTASKVELIARPTPIGSRHANLLVQSVQVFGSPVERPKLRPGKSMLNNSLQIFGRMQDSDYRLARITNGSSNRTVAKECEWLMKEILRVGVELTYERSGRFTRDLYFCWKDFSQFYPEHSKTMWDVLVYGA